MGLSSAVGKTSAKARARWGDLNRYADVMIVQILINKWIQHSDFRVGDPISSKNPLIYVDGKIGGQTIGAIVDFQRRACGFSSPDGLVEPGGTTFTVLDEPPRPVGGGGKGTTGGGGKKVIAWAVAAVIEHPEGARAGDVPGAHFLKASDGARPGRADGNPRGRNVELHERGGAPEDRFLHGAKCGTYLCGGRPGVHGHPKADRKDVVAYLADMGGTGLATSEWIGLNVWRDAGVHDRLARAGSAAAKKSIVRGSLRNATRPHLFPRHFPGLGFRLVESCRGRRHFDCIGLVSYCYSRVLGRKWRFTPDQIHRQSSFAKRALPGAPEAPFDGPSLKGDLASGDILYKLKPGRIQFHMGLFSAENGGHVVHAPGWRSGVLTEPFDPDRNAQRFEFVARFGSL